MRLGRITLVEFFFEGSLVFILGYFFFLSFDDFVIFCDEILGMYKCFFDISNYDNRFSDFLEERVLSEVSNRFLFNFDFSYLGKDNFL